MPVSLSVSLSLAFAAASVAVAALSLTPTYLTGVAGVEDTVKALRSSIDKNLEAALVGYLREPQLVNDVLAMEYEIGNQGTSPAQQQMYKRWCFRMLQANTNSLYIALATYDGGRAIANGSHAGWFLGCEVVRRGSDETFVWHVRNETTGADRWSVLVERETFREFRVARAKPYDPRERGWWEKLSQAQGWTETYLFSDGSKFAVTSGKPVRDASGALLAVVTTDYGVSMVSAPQRGADAALARSFSRTLEGFDYGKTGAAVALDTRDGVVLGTSWGERLVMDVAGTTARDAADAVVPKRAEDLTEHRMMQEVLAALARETGRGVLHHPSGMYYYGGRWVSVLDVEDPYGFALRVVTAIPSNDFLGEIRAQRGLSIGVVVALVAVVVLCGAAFARGITGSVQQLAENMKACATMKLDRVDTSTGSVLTEVRSMQHSFAKMHSNLVEYRGFLPQSVLIASELDADGACSDCSAATPQSGGAASSAGQLSVTSLGGSDGSRALSRGSFGSAGVDVMSRGESVEMNNSMWMRLAVQLLSRKVSLVVLNIVGFADLARAAEGKDILDTHSALLLWIQSEATPGRGIIETFSGDRFFVTYNASKMTVAHRDAAGRLAAGFSEHCQAGGLTPSAAVVTGEAKVGNMGSATMRKFSVLSPLVPFVHALERHARNLAAGVLCDAALQREWRRVYLVRHAGLFRLAKVQDAPVAVFQVMRRKEAAGDAEWLYELEAAEKKNVWKDWDAFVLAVLSGDWEVAEGLRHVLGTAPSHKDSVGSKTPVEGSLTAVLGEALRRRGYAVPDYSPCF